MNIKKIIIIGCLILSFLTLFYCLSPRITNFNGVISENGIMKTANITIKNKRVDKFLNRMTGSIYVKIKDDEPTFKEDYESEFEYMFSYGSILKVGEPEKIFYFTGVSRFHTILINRPDSAYETKYETGYMYFDKGFKNIAIITDERAIYAADENFKNMVESFN